MSLSATEVQARSVTIYKVIAGLEGSLLSYNEEQQALHHDEAGDAQPKQLLDWRALYTQFQRKHVLGTVPYRWDKGFMDATLVSATFDNLDIVVLEGDMMHDGSVSGKEKALAVKRLLGLDEEVALMEMLGTQGKVALVKETDDEWELVIPHELLAKLKFIEHRVAHFKRHAALPITHRWRLAANDAWEAWNDEVEPESIPDADMSWMECSDSLKDRGDYFQAQPRERLSTACTDPGSDTSACTEQPPTQLAS
mmetsp:Transcript_65592/g.122283  ORF Transcript_65592/g.122283 Transcript_65592/m.122283 type:complete len:253 (-) Transcript_65592:9-767(-)